MKRSSDAPRKLCSARKRSVSGKCFSCAKAKRQQQSAQSERKSTTRYGDEPIKTSFLLLRNLREVSISKR
ncbi:hypothetical protein [Lysinibacillus sp. G4S2]|uniref:hypothetical protein n=1 Tax=Lysinibacillus sp. G4S2 TaxID=3055859 RepID=UPI0025A0C7C1|nr:hypothetical protein [Lysinibacillus sp. G4S2]MDM5248080.1 hypothetical protein [Lysinibacillus sp. G4S2]